MKAFTIATALVMAVMLASPAAAVSEPSGVLTGSVISMEEGSLVISSYDGGEKSLVVFETTDETRIGGTDAMGKLQEGDTVQVAYDTNEEGKVAVSIVKMISNINAIMEN